MSLSEEDQRPGHHRDVLQDLLLHLGQRGDVGEVSLVLAGHPLGSLQVGDLSPDEVGEDPDRLVRLVVLLREENISCLRWRDHSLTWKMVS